MDSRVKGEFMRTPTRKAKHGVPPRQAMASGKTKRGGRKKRSRINQLGLIALIAFIFFTPDARQFVLAKWAEVEEYIMDGLAPHQVYPLEAEYTVVRSIDLWNNGTSNGHLEESIPLPVDVSSNERDSVALAFTDGTEVPTSQIQTILSLELRIDGETISIPTDGNPPRSKANAINTSDNSQVWWPGQGLGSDMCPHGPCVRVSIDVPSGTHESVDFAVTLNSATHTWWHSTRMDSKIEGKSEGVSVARSGTFDDIAQRGEGIQSSQFASMPWYDRNDGNNPSNWAIDGRLSNAPTIFQTAASIEASLPGNLKDNAYAYARATFDWLNDNVPYDTNAPNVARSGEQCLDAGMGDCDEQSNAWMSLLRTRNIPAWYEFGPMTDGQFSGWEPHAWANAIFPFDTDWCDENGIMLEACFIEGEVDVVNNRWLLHTPTTLTEWIETPSNLGDAAYDFYRPLSIGCVNCWTETWETIGEAEISGGTFRVPVRIGE